MILSRVVLQGITRRAVAPAPAAVAVGASLASSSSSFARSYATSRKKKGGPTSPITSPPPATAQPATEEPVVADPYHGEIPPPPPSDIPTPSPSPPEEPASMVSDSAVPPPPFASSAAPTEPLAETSASTSTAAPTGPGSSIATKNLAEDFIDSLDLAPPTRTTSGDAFGATTGARSRSNATSSTEKKRKNLSRIALLLGLAGTVSAATWLSREWEEGEGDKLRVRSEDEEGKEWEQRDEWYYKRLGRARLRGADIFDYLNKPAWDPLLPPPLPPPHYKPYTLVIDLDDLLVHSSWDVEHGWRTAKRPGLDYFLAYLSIFYEIVLFTTQPAYTASPIIEKIDPYGANIPWKLFRESTRYKNKALIKDLSYLGRPLSRTLVLETNPEHTQLHPENTILLTPWLGKASSGETTKELVDLIPFLEAIAIKMVPDVRVLVQHYGGKDIGRQYAEIEERNKREVREKWEKEQTERGWLAKALVGLVKTSNPEAPPETEIEKGRKRAQAYYLEEQKYWKDNEAEIKKSMDEDRERQLKEMKGSLISFMGLQAPQQPGAEQQQATTK